MRKWGDILTSYVTVFCFLLYTATVPTLAYAQDGDPEPPAQSVPALDLSLCTNIKLVPNLNLTLPNLTGCENCFAYVVSPTGPWRLYNDKGELADISGLFINDTASANLAAELTLLEKTWTAQYERTLEHNIACMQRQYGLLNIRYDSLKSITDAKEIELQRIIAVQNEQIDKLSHTPWYKTTEFGVIVGVALGIGLTIGTGYALGQIDN